MSDDTATIERDLAAVEEALASGTPTIGDPVARELQELALALRADSPSAGPEFARELRERMEQGFPRDPRARQQAALARLARKAARRRTPFGKLAHDFAPLAGVVATILLIVGIAVALDGGSGEDFDAASGGGSIELSDDGGGGGGRGESPADAPAVSDEAGRSSGGDTAVSPGADAVPLSPGDPDFAPRQLERKIERSYSLELEVERARMNRVADEVTAVTNRHGGFVLNSSVTSGEDGGGGDFSLRIPTARLRPALRDLAELAPVIRQSQQGRDVTRQHVTARDRLEAARAERRSLLRRLEEADTDEEAEAIRRRLDLVAAEISGLRAQLRDLRLRTDYAVVEVSLLTRDGDSGTGGAGGSFDDAVDDAGNLLVGFAGVLIRALALAIPLSLIALVAWLAARAARRRRRESALA